MMEKEKVTNIIVYGVVPHNFGKRGFRDVTAKLDYLAELGINAIWIAPANPTPTGGHGYDVSNYFELRSDYGTKEDFKEMIDEAHQRGIKVLMDFVPNHTSIDHPYMREALIEREASPYYDFYDRDESGDYTHYFNWENLPNLNFDNLKVVEWIIAAFSYWVREFDVDGFRVDVAWGIKQRRPDFWSACRQALDRIKPDILMLAEASARDPYYFDNGFEAAYDWTDELGHWSMEEVFEDEEKLIERLDASLTNQGRGFHEDAVVFRFLNNNDTAERFITRYGLDMTRVAAAMLLTFPGLPCIYTGQEVGAEYEPYKTPGPISWENRDDLRDYYKKLINIRQSLPCLSASTKWEKIKVNPEKKIYAYLRPGHEEGGSALIILNFSGEECKAELALPEGFTAELKNLLNDEIVIVEEGKITIEPYQVLILVNFE